VGGNDGRGAEDQAGGFLWDLESGFVTCDSIARQLLGFELGPDCDLMRLNDILCQITAADQARVERSLSDSIRVDVPFVIPFQVGGVRPVELRAERRRSPGHRDQVLGIIRRAGGTPSPLTAQETGLDALAPLLDEAVSIAASENLSFLTWLLRLALLEAGKSARSGVAPPGH
jgi:hypothetical protein